MCDCGRVSRSALSAGKVRMKSPIAPPRITRMRFIRFTVAALYERRNYSRRSETATDLVLGKREFENHAAVHQRERMQAPPAKNTTCAPINLVAKDIRNCHPEQARDNQQVSKNSYKQATRFVAQKSRIKQWFRREQTKNRESAHREEFIHEKQREYVTDWQSNEERPTKA